jgi:hypothetical protein
MREGGKANLAAAIGHADSLLDRGLGAGTFDDIIGTDSAGELLDDGNGIFLVDIDDAVRAQLLADGKALVARSREDHGARADRLRDSDRQ